MTGSIESRLARLEAKRRPVRRIESKAERDARVADWAATCMTLVPPSDPQQRAAVIAGMRADT